MAGLYYEEFEVGHIFRHSIRRTLTETDNTWFTGVTQNPDALHLDEEHCQLESEFGTRIINSCFTLGLMMGIADEDTMLGTVVANLGWDEIRMTKPVLPGDTLHVETEVVEKRDSKSRPQNGIVTLEHRAFNQRNELVGKCRCTTLQKRLPAERSNT